MLQIPDGDETEPPEALDMSWPDTNRKRITYVLVAPIVFPLWLTLPDTRTPRGKRCLLLRSHLLLPTVPAVFCSIPPTSPDAS